MSSHDNERHQSSFVPKVLGKRFPGVVALDDVCVHASPRRSPCAHGGKRCRQKHAHQGHHRRLCRKTTARSTLDGVSRSTAASPKRCGRPVGIRTVYQEVNLVPYLSVAENLLIGSLPEGGRADDAVGQSSRDGARSDEASVGIDIDVSRSTNVRTRSRFSRWSRSARAVMDDDRRVATKVLVLDEPTSSLDAAEVDQLFRRDDDAAQIQRRRRSYSSRTSWIRSIASAIASQCCATANTSASIWQEGLAAARTRVSRMMGRKSLKRSSAMNCNIARQTSSSGQKTSPSGIEVKGLGRKAGIGRARHLPDPSKAKPSAWRALLGSWSNRSRTTASTASIKVPTAGTLTLDGEAVDHDRARRER